VPHVAGNVANPDAERDGGKWRVLQGWRVDPYRTGIRPGELREPRDQSKLLQVPELTFLTAGKADCNQKPAAWEPLCLRSDGSRMG
jgi:hypothetical protein